jgi:hypothetical protein
MKDGMRAVGWAALLLLTAGSARSSAQGVVVLLSPDAPHSQGGVVNQAGIDPNAFLRLKPGTSTTPSTAMVGFGFINVNTGQLIPNLDILIESSPVPFSGGHSHDDGNRPGGSFQPQSGNTGPGGLLQVTYTAPQVAGLINVTVVCTSILCSPFIGRVDVSIDLVAVTAGTLIGDTQQHPSNHWGTPSLAQAVTDLENLYEARFNSSLQFNDSSLQWGGLFDCGANAPPCRATAQPWFPPHLSHRWGTDQDMDITSVPVARRNEVLHMIGLARMRTFQEDAQHWHLTVLF